MAKTCVEPDDRFVILLENAASDLFTFVRYLDMEPTNNEYERIVLATKIRSLWPPAVSRPPKPKGFDRSSHGKYT